MSQISSDWCQTLLDFPQQTHKREQSWHSATISGAERVFFWGRGGVQRPFPAPMLALRSTLVNGPFFPIA